MQRPGHTEPVPQDPSKRGNAVEGGQGVVVPRPGGEGLEGTLLGHQTVRRLFQQHRRGDKDPGRDPRSLGHGHRRVRC